MTLTGLMIAQLGIVLFFARRWPVVGVIAVEALRCVLWLGLWYALMAVAVWGLIQFQDAPAFSVQYALNILPPIVAWVVVSVILRWLKLVKPLPARSLDLVRASFGMAVWGGLVAPNLALDQAGAQEAAFAALVVVLIGPALALATPPARQPPTIGGKGRHVSA